jgi:polyhydroxyalkanoate synthesis regulator phasin
MQPKPVPAPAAPSPVPKALQIREQEKSGRGIMGKLFPKMKRQGFEDGGPVLDEAAEPGEVMATAPEVDPTNISGAAPVENAAAEAIPQMDKGELPAEVPGDGSDKVATEGPFSEYLKEGVDPQLVEKGNELTKRLAESSSDEATMTQFMADAKDYIDELGNAVKTAQGQGGGEMLRGLKAMLKDAQDLMTAHENIMAETGSADQAIQNAPDIVMMASRKSEAA